MNKLLSRWLSSAKGKLSLRLKVDPNHPLLILYRALDWVLLVKIVEKHREMHLKNGAGRKPHLRVLVAAILVRTIKSCTLRETQDLIQHYAPARILCELRWSLWTPNFRTLSDFEIMIGEEGLKEIIAYVLGVAQKLGFADIQGLCSDTTAQEAQIPYPNEVGIMDGLLRSAQAGINVLGRFLGKKKVKILEKISEAKTLVREHRLFAKTIEEKRDLGKELHRKVQVILSALNQGTQASSGKVKCLKKHGKVALKRIQQIQEVFQTLSPQIQYFLNTGKVAKNKIISLFHPLLRSIPRGKNGKKTEFGIRWGINRIRGGYVWLFTRIQKRGQGEADYMVQAVHEHIQLFGKAPKDFGYDRGGWSEPHMVKLQKLGVKRVAVAPKGQTDWKVSNRCKEKMVKERAQVEGTIGTLKSYGFNKPHVKTTPGMFRAGQRAALRYNLMKLVRDTQSTLKQKKAT